MKITLPIFISLVTICSCANQNNGTVNPASETAIETSEKITETTEVIKETENPKAEVVKSIEERRKEVITLIPFKTKYTAVVGQKLVYTASVHGSVGSATTVSAPSEDIVKLMDSEHKYKDPSKKDMSGGDAATVTYTFEALKAGTGHVFIEKSFRGELENRYELEITVE